MAVSGRPNRFKRMRDAHWRWDLLGALVRNVDLKSDRQKKERLTVFSYSERNNFVNVFTTL